MKLQYHESKALEIRKLAECNGKDAMTQKRATEVAQRMRSRKPAASRVTAYRCSVCHEWHVGSVPPMLKGHRK